MADHHVGHFLRVRGLGGHIADELPVAQNSHAVGQVFNLVRDDDDRLARVAHVAQYGKELVRLLRGQDGGRLVKNEYVRAAVEHLDYLNGLLLGDGHVVYLLVRVNVKAVFLADVAHALSYGFHIEPAWLLEAENNVLRRGQDIDELEMLVDHADAEIKRVLRRADDDLLVVDEDLPLIRKIYAGEHVHERGLAAAVFAEQGEDLAAIDVQPDLVVCDDRTEGLRNVAHSHCGMLAVQRRQLLAVRCKEIILYSVV